MSPLATALTTLSLAQIRKVLASHPKAAQLVELAKTIRNYARRDCGAEFVTLHTTDFADLAGVSTVHALHVASGLTPAEITATEQESSMYASLNLLTLILPELTDAELAQVTLSSIADQLTELEDFVEVEGDSFLGALAHWRKLTSSKQKFALNTWILLWNAATDEGRNKIRARADRYFA